MDILSNIDHVIAVYTYSLPHASIPLVIVEDAVQWTTLKACDVWQKGGIILTRKDIQQGQDVFALRFLHMQEHASFVSWEDILLSLEIDHAHVRHACEAMLRVMLIDLREYMVQENIHEDMCTMLGISLSRIQSFLSVASMDDAMQKIFAEYSTRCQEKNMTHEDLVALYGHLLSLTHHWNG